MHPKAKGASTLVKCASNAHECMIHAMDAFSVHLYWVALKACKVVSLVDIDLSSMRVSHDSPMQTHLKVTRYEITKYKHKHNYYKIIFNLIQITQSN